MALKDWVKKTGLGMNKDITEWYNKNKDQFITNRKGWANITIFVDGKNIEKSFKTEIAKLKYIRNYMIKN